MTEKRRFAKSSAIALMLFSVIVMIGQAFAASDRALIPDDSAGSKAVAEYQASYALVIGISRYTAGWPKLESIPKEMAEIKAALKSQGFNITQVMDPDADELKDGFENFIDAYGYNRRNRLLFFFSGHGYSDEDDMGYLVPTDAPEALAASIVRLLEDRQLARQLGHNARQDAKEKYTLSKMARSYESIYDDCCA